MTSRLRKLVLVVHLTASISWLGALAVFLALATMAVTRSDEVLVRSACISMSTTVTWVILPLAFTSLLSGLASALGTPWGLFRHYWVVIKLTLTCLALIVLLIQLAPIAQLADAARDASVSPSALASSSRRQLVHAVGGWILLLVVQVLGVYKPRGMTPRGVREAARRATSG